MNAPVTAARATVTTRSEEETRALASALAAVARAGDRISLFGPLGAGKTQFAKGFATGLGVREVVNSPSFTLMAEYRGRLPLFHLDLYRLTGAEEAIAGGLLDERQSLGVTLVEWAERLGSHSPDHLHVRFDVLDDDRRRIELSGGPAGYSRYLEAVPGSLP